MASYRPRRSTQPSYGGSAPGPCCCWSGVRDASTSCGSSCATGLLVGSLFGLAFSANDTSIAGAYTAFTCTILLWGAQEIAFLAGWLTGPRPQPCPAGASGWRRLGFALQAILYHELALLTCGAADRSR